MSEEYIKGSFAGKTFPIVAGESMCKEGTCYIHLDTVKKSGKPEVVRLHLKTSDTKGNETGLVTMLLTQEVAKLIGNEMSISLFDSRYKIPLGGDYAST